MSSVCRSRSGSRESALRGDQMSDDSSNQSLPEHVVYPSLEESWLVTPPPCFTAGGTSPEHVQSSPMEDLLIEHPSMSVYTAPRRRPGSTGIDSAASSDDDSDARLPEPMAVLVQPVHRPHAVAAHVGLTPHVKSVKIMQAAEKRHADRRIGRKNLERNNKVRDYQAHAKRHQRSKKYAIKPSGVCNNRRC